MAKKKLRRLQIREVAYVDNGGNQHADMVFAKRRPPSEQDTNMPVDPNPAPTSQTSPSIGEGAPARQAPPVDVAVNAAFQKHLDAQTQEIRKLREQNEAFAKLMDERDKAEEIAKCAVYTSVKVDGLADKMHAIRKASPDIYTSVHEILTAAEAVCKTADQTLTAELGTSGTTETASSYEVATREAEKLLSSGVCKTMPEAIAKAYMDNPKLYDAYETENTSRIAVRGQ